MIGKTIANRYKVYDKVGSGGMAEVFLARDLESGEIVAMKVLREQFTEGQDYIERFEREAKSATKLNHPNVCQTRDYGQEDDVYYMVMEYIEGKTLSAVIEDKGPLSIHETSSYIIQISKALEHAYENGLVAHRDIKSQNIMVTAAGQVKIMDFGIAKSKDFATMTSAGSFVGTPEYMSPEQAQGEKVDKRSDIYSLGVVFYEALAGEVPFESDTPWGVLNMHINKEPFPLNNIRKDVPKDLVDVIQRMMVKDLDERFQNPRELIATLEAVMETIKLPKGSKIKKKKIPRSNPKRARKVKRIILIILILLLLGGGAYYYFEYLAPKPVNISVDTEPDGALIELNGPNDTEFIKIGTGDLIIEKIFPGKYEIRISMDGFVSVESSFNVDKSGKDKILDQIILKKPGKFELVTENIDWGAVEEIPSPGEIEIKNIGESQLIVKRTKSGDWFTMETSDLTILAGSDVKFPIIVNGTDLAPGSYAGLIILEPEIGEKVTIDVKLELVEPKPEVVVDPIPPPVSGGGDSSGGTSGGTETPPPPPPATEGFLSLECNVNGLAVFIDGNHVGRIPLKSQELSPGKHTITIIGGKKYKTQKKSVTIVAGETTTLNFKMELK